MGVTEAETKRYQQDIDWSNGLFSEYGAKAVLLPKLMPLILTEERYAVGMDNFVELLHIVGVTSAMDMGIGVFGDPEGEIKLIQSAIDGKDAPNRIALTPLITDLITRKLSPKEALAQVKKWEVRSTDKVILDNHFKMMMDAAAFSELGQMGSE